MKQSRKDKLLNDVGPSSKNELKTTNPIGESKNHTNIKPVTVLRISESELRKSCKDMQEELATEEVIAEEKTVVDDKSWSVVDCTELLAKLTISNSEVGDKDTSDVRNGPSNVSCSKGNPFLYRTGIVKAHLPGNSDEDEDGVGVSFGNGKDEVKHLQTQNSSQDFTEDNQERASSPSNSDGSDEVFTNTSKPASTEIDAGHKNQVLPALHRGEFKKPRRPFKSDSSVISRTESIEASTTLLSDTKEGRCNNKSTLARSQSEVATSFERTNISCGLATETDPESVAVLNDAKDSKIVSNESQVGDEQDHSTGNVTENWREILPVTDNSLGDQNADISERPDCNESKLSFGTADSDSQEHKNGQSSGMQNWRERPPIKESDSRNQSNNASNENWRERTSDHLGDLWRKGSHLQNWRDRKSISMDESRKDAACNPSFGGSSKRYSTGDIPLERQDSNEKGL